MKTNSFEKRWSEKIAEKGHTQIPNCLMTCQSKLGITVPEAWLIVCLLQYKYDTRMPFPKVRTLADRMMKSESSVRKNLASLEKKKIIKRVYRTGLTSQYDFSPLITKLHTHNCQMAGKKIKPKIEKFTEPPSPYFHTKEDEVEVIQNSNTNNKTKSLVVHANETIIKQRKTSYQDSPYWYKDLVNDLADGMSVN